MDQLVELDGCLRRLLDVLKVQGVRDGKETLVLARKNNGDELVEVARDCKESLALARNINRVVKRIERLVPRPHKGKWRKERSRKVSSMSRSGTRNPIWEAELPEGQFSETSNSRIFTYGELKTATRNFRREGILLGEDGFGKTFKGWLDEETHVPSKVGTGMIVAIKKWNPESFQGLHEWQTEVDLLGRLSHPNIVKLIGHCSEDKELLLVYEFMQKGSLEDHLFRKNPETEAVLSWDNRLKIAIGAARALTFLHSLQTQIIHRDFKTSNISLDENYNAKLSGFGLAKLGPSDGESYVETQVMGTYGYAAPEYIATGFLHVKSDVYSFGVVLLEILTGLRVVDRNRPSQKQNLVDWATPLLSHKRKLETFMDAKIKGQYSSKEALDMANITGKCLVQDPEVRPSMKEVVDALEEIQASKDNSKQTELTTANSTLSSQS